MKTDKLATPRLYVADLAAYVVGKLHGEWIDLTPGITVEEVREAIQAMLKQSPVLPGDVAEEHAIHDYEGFHGYEVDEYEHLETVVKVAAFIAEHGELGAKLVNHSYDIDEAVQVLEEQHAGSADTLGDWIEAYMEDGGQLDEIPERWRTCLDLERYARDLELGGDIFTINTNSGAVHVFWTR